jgi:hypothetical protein
MTLKCQRESLGHAIDERATSLRALSLQCCGATVVPKLSPQCWRDEARRSDSVT